MVLCESTYVFTPTQGSIMLNPNLFRVHSQVSLVSMSPRSFHDFLAFILKQTTFREIDFAMSIDALENERELEPQHTVEAWGRLRCTWHSGWRWMYPGGCV